MSIAQYQIGPEQRPQLHHDPGFADCIRPATVKDRALYLGWRGFLEAAEAGQKVPFVPHNDLPDGLAAYRHFLYGRGRARKFSYDRYVANDKAGEITLENAIVDLQDGIEEIAAQNPYGSGFQVTGTGIRCDNKSMWSHLFPYPKTENWQKAIGAHWIWLSATVGVSRGTPRSFVATMTLHAEDLYNFNPGAQDVGTSIPDALNGPLEESCLGQDYLNVSTLVRVLRWEEADYSWVDNAKRDSPDRAPNDNRRLRNRM